MSRRRFTVILPAVVLSTIITGYFAVHWAVNSSAVSLTEDERLRNERKAIERLKENGCQAEEKTDEWIGQSGILLTLFPEHIDDRGHLVTEVVSDLRFLRNCFLVLDRTPVSNEGLSDLKSLDNLLLLSLQETPVTDEGMGHIEGIISLRLLRLNWTRVTDHGLRYIDRLPDLVMLYLSGTQITDQAMQHIVALKKLAALQMSYTRITDRACADLPLLPELQFLGLDGTRVTDAGMTHIEDCPKLSYVNLTRTTLTDKRLVALRAAIPDCRVVRNITVHQLKNPLPSERPQPDSP